MISMHMEREIAFAFKLYNIDVTRKYINSTNNRPPRWRVYIEMFLVDKPLGINSKWNVH